MNLNKLIVAAACVAACSGAWAENINSSGTSLSSGSAGFSIKHLNNGAFTDTINFTGGPSFADASGSLTTIALSAGNNDINFTSASLNGVAYTLSPSGVFEFGSVMTTNLAGPFVVTVTGVANLGSGDSASYSGTLNVMAVPEPQTYALMLAGLAAIGFVAARSRRNG